MSSNDRQETKTKVSHLQATMKIKRGLFNEAVEILSTLIMEGQGVLSNDEMIELYTERAECFHRLEKCQEAMLDAQHAADRGLQIEENEHIFLLLKHSDLEVKVDSIIKQMQQLNKEQTSWNCSRVIRFLQNLKLKGVFCKMDNSRERSRSADRLRR